MIEKKDWLLFAVAFPMAIWGSVARTLADNWAKGKRGWTLIGLIIVNATISGFCALLIVPLSKILHFDFWLSMFSAGVAGYMGIGFITLAEAFFKKRLGGLENADDA